MNSDRPNASGAFREQQFDRAEARQLLLQALAQPGAVEDGTISKLELVELASRLGVEPQKLFEPTAVIPRPQPEPRTPLWGMVLKSRQELSFDGLVDDETVEEIVELCRERTGILGRLDNYGKSLVWTSSTMGQNQRLLVVRVSRRNGQSSLLVEELNWPVLIALWVGGGVGVGVGVGVPMTVALAAAGLASIASFLFASWILLVLLVIFWIARSIGKGRAAVRRSITEGAAALIQKAVLQRDAADPQAATRARVQPAPEQKQVRFASSAAPDSDLDNAEPDAEAESAARSRGLR